MDCWDFKNDAHMLPRDEGEERGNKTCLSQENFFSFATKEYRARNIDRKLLEFWNYKFFLLLWGCRKLEAI